MKPAPPVTATRTLLSLSMTGQLSYFELGSS